MNKRAHEVGTKIWRDILGYATGQAILNKMIQLLTSLPEFEEPEWHSHNCEHDLLATDRIWILHGGKVYSGFPADMEHGDKWQYNKPPEAPADEESDLVKSVRHVFYDRYPSMPSCEANTMAEVIDEIKRYEKEAQK